ncbi:MAG TPA: aldo/keto reductase [Acidimicrobiales bacterium]|nr:aldo/keto reductase [Acidimicrobiales bacterium]
MADRSASVPVDESKPARASGTFALGGDLLVHRLGFGAMQLPGPGVWGEPTNRDEALLVLQRAIDLGVDFIDTADSYGPFVSELLIREALRPYPAGLVIATKAGLTRQGPGRWTPVGRPAYLRQQVELSLRHLGVERIDLLQLHRVDPQVPLEDQVGELAAMRTEGKIRHVGLSEVRVEEIEAAQRIVPVVSVQNRYNLVDRASEAVLEHAERAGIGFIPWFPLATGRLATPGGPLAELARSRGVSPSQLALAWLLARSPVMLPIPGTSSVSHLEENVAAASIELDDGERKALEQAA